MMFLAPLAWLQPLKYCSVHILNIFFSLFTPTPQVGREEDTDQQCPWARQQRQRRPGTRARAPCGDGALANPRPCTSAAWRHRARAWTARQVTRYVCVLGSVTEVLNESLGECVCTRCLVNGSGLHGSAGVRSWEAKRHVAHCACLTPVPLAPSRSTLPVCGRAHFILSITKHFLVYLSLSVRVILIKQGSFVSFLLPSFGPPLLPPPARPR